MTELTSLNEMLGVLAAGIKNPKPNNHQYEPHDPQLVFHASEKPGRQFIGGNRSGKSVAGANEAVWWMTGRHPFLRLPPAPIQGRVVTVDFKNGANKIIIPQLKQWLPPSDLINGSWEDSYNKQQGVLTLENGSELEIMSHEQELDKFAGVPRHFTWFDEEPPQDIFQECLARLIDYNGRWWMTMTPVEGMTWTFDEIYEKKSDHIEIIEVDTSENPHVDHEALDRVISGYSEDEQEIRKKGKYVAVSGLILKHFDPDVHIIPEGIPPAHWTHYRSLDHGFNNPTAICYHAVDPETGNVVTYLEHYMREWVVKQHAAWVNETDARLRKEYGIEIYLGVADPAIEQRSAVTGHSIRIEYANAGVNWALGKQRNVNAGLDKMINYQYLNRWFVTENCRKTIWEMRRYKWGDFASSKVKQNNNRKEQPQKKDDHAMDSIRYFFSFMPELNPKTEPINKVRPNFLNAPTYDLATGGRAFDPHFVEDKTLYLPQTAADEYVGEW